jgi:hypothetical protein
LVDILINHPIKTSLLFYYKITSLVYSVKMADDERFASISEAEMHEIVENIDAANTKEHTHTLL